MFGYGNLTALETLAFAQARLGLGIRVRALDKVTVEQVCLCLWEICVK